MSNFFDNVKRSAKVFKKALGPGRYMAGGIKVKCPHCENEIFEEGSAQLNTAGMSFLDLDWLNKSATVLSCTNCGLIQWYGKSPERID
ncbi:zinc ribbon domain-containing protein [Tepidibacillus marianensis]|uniref:zinc ribbon domain-containing protein n=1 Tax=Tepidibacillus marianensis TaxID=3131995 RepID=UPI0030CC1C3B